MITEEEAERATDNGYLLDLARHNNINSLDALRTGGVARFLNHSCNPNSFLQRVFIGHHDRRFPRMALFASKPIPAFTELTWDYGDWYRRTERVGLFSRPCLCTPGCTNFLRAAK